MNLFCLDICISAKSNLKTLVLSTPSSGGSKLQGPVVRKPVN